MAKPSLFIICLLPLFIEVHEVKADFFDLCKNNDDCDTLNSVCMSSKCSCMEGFVENDGQCCEVLKNMPQCNEEKDCNLNVRRSFCANSKCVCLPHHNYRGNECIRNRGVFEKCSTDSECYWGKDMLDKLGCINGECSCKANYKLTPDKRKCSSGQRAVVGLLIMQLPILLMFFK